jgi:hypothetical protein
MNPFIPAYIIDAIEKEEYEENVIQLPLPLVYSDIPLSKSEDGESEGNKIIVIEL